MTRVLIVEDEESFADPLAFLLRKEGFTTAVAATGQDALEEFDRNGADIVLLDLMLPGLPGTEVCRRLRQVSSVPSWEPTTTSPSPTPHGSSSPASVLSCAAVARAPPRSTACRVCWRPARSGWTSSGTSCR